MTPSTLDVPVSLLRRRLIDDMTMRRFSRETQRNYIRDVGRFATFLGGPPDRATADDLRRFQVEQREAGVPVPTQNSIVSALRFFFTQTLDRPDLARKLVRLAHPRRLPVRASGAEPPTLSVPARSADTVASTVARVSSIRPDAATSIGGRPALRACGVARLASCSRRTNPLRGMGARVERWVDPGRARLR